jgi:hypothetical protein
MRIIINEDEKNDISSQHEEIDSNIFNFLIRRITVIDRNLSSELNDEKPLKVIEYRFDGFPGFGFNSFNNRKQMQNKILELLVDNDMIDDNFFSRPQNFYDPESQKILKTIRKFLNFILIDQK